MTGRSVSSWAILAATMGFSARAAAAGGAAPSATPPDAPAPPAYPPPEDAASWAERQRAYAAWWAEQSRPPEQSWYGWQTLIVDLTSLGLVIGAAAAPDGGGP